MKKIVALGGGTGLSTLISDLKDFPIDLTAIIAVSDNGRSTGRLRHEFDIPAVGDIRKVLTHMSNLPLPLKRVMEYRFSTDSDLNGHSLGNLILTSLLKDTGSLMDSVSEMSFLLDVRQKAYPLSEDNLTLMAEDIKGNIIKGEEEITESKVPKKRLFYDKEPVINKKVIAAIKNADLIILSMGSLYTSILPHLIVNEIKDAIAASKAKIMYVSNVMTQPGETDNFKVSDHIKTLNGYLKERKVDVVLCNKNVPNKGILNKYKKLENKDYVKVDKNELKKMNVELLTENLITLADGTIKHNSMKVAAHIYAYLMK